MARTDGKSGTMGRSGSKVSFNETCLTCVEDPSGVTFVTHSGAILRLTLKTDGASARVVMEDYAGNPRTLYSGGIPDAIAVFTDIKESVAKQSQKSWRPDNIPLLPAIAIGLMLGIVALSPMYFFVDRHHTHSIGDVQNYDQSDKRSAPTTVRVEPALTMPDLERRPTTPHSEDDHHHPHPNSIPRETGMPKPPEPTPTFQPRSSSTSATSGDMNQTDRPTAPRNSSSVTSSPVPAARPLAEALTPPQGAGSGTQVLNLNLLTPNQAAQALIALEGIKQDGRISEHRLNDLPKEVAEAVRKMLAGSSPRNPIEDVQSPESTARRAENSNAPIPDTLRNLTRNIHGVPTIPQEGSWLANSPVPILPLPGGGDIRSGEDFHGFGLDLPQSTP
jgi:hypothetical protein